MKEINCLKKWFECPVCGNLLYFCSDSDMENCFAAICNNIYAEHVYLWEEEIENGETLGDKIGATKELFIEIEEEYPQQFHEPWEMVKKGEW